MKHTSILHNLPRGRNLYAGDSPAVLRTEAARLDDNRRLIASDLHRDPSSWAGGWGNVDVLDVLFADAIAMMLSGPLMGGAA